MDEVVKRLRETKKKANRATREYGLVCGRQWAMDTAVAGELETLEGYQGEDDAWSLVEALVPEHDGSGTCRPYDYNTFWEFAVGDDFHQ